MKKFLYCFIALTALAAPAHATQVQEVVTPSGIRAWLVEEHALPLLAIRVAFTDSGYAHDPEATVGTSNMVAAMLMEGAGELDSAAFNALLESHAIRMNTSSDEDKIEAFVEALSEKKELAFAYLGLALSKPRFDNSAMERVRRQTFSLIERQQQDPGYAAYRALYQAAFQSHPYARPALGTRETVTAISKTDLQTFASQRLTRANMLVAVSGDITASELSDLLEKHFSSLPQQFTTSTTVTDVVVPAQEQSVFVPFSLPQTVVFFGTQGLKRTDPAYFTGHVMNHIIGGGTLNSLLGNEIREKRGLAYSVSSAMSPMSHGSLWRGGFSTRTEKAPEAIETLKATLAQFAQNGPTDAQLKDAKDYLTGSFVLNLDSNAAITAFMIPMQEYNLGRDYFDTRNQQVSAVTREAVQALAKQLIDPQRLLLVTVGETNPTAKTP